MSEAPEKLEVEYVRCPKCGTVVPWVKGEPFECPACSREEDFALRWAGSRSSRSE